MERFATVDQDIVALRQGLLNGFTRMGERVWQACRVPALHIVDLACRRRVLHLVLAVPLSDAIHYAPYVLFILPELFPLYRPKVGQNEPAIR
jgi:hypothetical protein